MKHEHGRCWRSGNCQQLPVILRQRQDKEGWTASTGDWGMKHHLSARGDPSQGRGGADQPGGWSSGQGGWDKNQKLRSPSPIWQLSFRNPEVTGGVVEPAGPVVRPKPSIGTYRGPRGESLCT